MVLEEEPDPVTIYDVQRAIAREYGRSIQRSSITSLMASDLRFCWAGKGIYGLFRHDLLPRVRTLSGVSMVLLAAHERPLQLSELAFVLKWVGYRFQDLSLEAALLRDHHLGFEFGSRVGPPWEPSVELLNAESARQVLTRRLAADENSQWGWPGVELMERWQAKVVAGLEERRRRLDGTPRSDPAGVPQSKLINLPTDTADDGALEGLAPDLVDLRCLLIEVARTARVSSYQPIGRLFGLDMSNPKHRQRIGDMLGEVSRFEVARSRPMLSSVVVLAQDSMPGAGFFNLGFELGLVRPDEDELAFAVRQMKETFAYWGKQMGTSG